METFTQARRIGFALVLLAAIAAHWSALEGDFVFDDVVAVVEHPALSGEGVDFEAIATQPYWGDRPGHERSAVYRPLVTLSFALNAPGGAPDPTTFRWVNLLLHALATLLAWRFAHALLSDERGAVMTHGGPRRRRGRGAFKLDELGKKRCRDHKS